MPRIDRPAPGRRFFRLVATVLAAAAVAAVAPGLGDAVAGAMSQAPATYYLAIGASESLGVQPTGPNLRAAPTDHGYANALLAIERRRWPTLQLVHFGCAGITAQAALSGGGPCRFQGGSEVHAAVEFLRAHPGQAVLATVDLGFNDLWPCLVHRHVDGRCVATAFTRVFQALPVIVRDLRAAGGPHLKIVGLLHNDPYLAAYLNGAKGRRFSAAALGVFERFNATLSAVYGKAHVRVANVASAFALGNSRPSLVAGHKRLPVDVARVCRLSWMCKRHNIHLNPAGYGAVASAIAAALPPLGGEAH